MKTHLYNYMILKAPWEVEILLRSPTIGGNVLSHLVGGFMAKCKIDNCDKDNGKGAWGYCGMHYQRVKRYGNPDYITPESIRAERSRNAQPRLGKCSPTTYKKYRGRHMHRVIAEEMLKRPLESHEHVHHIDGDRHNNDPKNLAVLTRVEHLKHHGKERQGKPPSRKLLLTPEQIKEIRASKLLQWQIAKIFGVTQTLISQIKLRKIYRYVE